MSPERIAVLRELGPEVLEDDAEWQALLDEAASARAEQGEPPLLRVLRDICEDATTTWPFPLDQNEAVAWLTYIDHLKAEQGGALPVNATPERGRYSATLVGEFDAHNAVIHWVTGDQTNAMLERAPERPKLTREQVRSLALDIGMRWKATDDSRQTTDLAIARLHELGIEVTE